MAPDGDAGSAFAGPVEATPASPTTPTGTREHESGELAGDGPPHDEREALRAALEREIATAAAHVAAATHRLLTAVRKFDEMEGWREQGARSCAHWLAWRVGMTPGIAREKVRVARALGRLPRIDEALRTAAISYSKARALTRVATPENEGELLGVAHEADAHELEKACRRFRRLALVRVEKRPRALAEERWLRFDLIEETGMMRVSGQLLPEEAAVLDRTLEVTGAIVRQRALALLARLQRVAPDVAAATRADGGAPAPDAADGEVSSGPPAGVGASARRLLVGEEELAGQNASPWFSRAELAQLSTFTRVDALLAVCESFLERPTLATRSRPRYEVVVQVQRAALEGGTDEPALLGDGTPISAETARRLSCDAAVVRTTTNADGATLDVGRRTRSIPSSIQKALRLRDKRCRFPGCTQDAALNAHHIQHWAQGGATKLSNLVRLCDLHHWFVHEGGGGMRVERGRLHFLDPRGRPIEHAPPVGVGGQPQADLLRWLRDHGPGEGIALPLPLGFGATADWTMEMAAWAEATYGPEVVDGDFSGVVPRMPYSDGHAPRQRHCA